MTTSEAEFKNVEEAYMAACGQGLKVKVSDVLAFLLCAGMVTVPLWVEEVAMWYWSL